MKPITCFVIIFWQLLVINADAQTWVFNPDPVKKFEEEQAENDTSYKAQKGFSEIGFIAGFSGYLGDLGGNKGKAAYYLKDYNAKYSKGLVGAFTTYTLSKSVDLRGNFVFTELQADDASIINQGDDEKWRLLRNLNFKSKIIEASVMMDFYPMYAIKKIFQKSKIPKIRPFVSVGLGVFKFNPYIFQNGSWFEAKPLRLEGQGMPEVPFVKNYATTSFNLNYGFGFKYKFSNTFYGAFEMHHRKTFTDYIDDVSGVYIDHNLFSTNLPKDKADIARDIYNRHLKGPVGSTPGLERGNRADKDAYFSIQVRAVLIINYTDYF